VELVGAVFPLRCHGITFFVGVQDSVAAWFFDALTGAVALAFSPEAIVAFRFGLRSAAARIAHCIDAFIAAGALGSCRALHASPFAITVTASTA
jgi:hypothetical protein